MLPNPPRGAFLTEHIMTFLFACLIFRRLEWIRLKPPVGNLDVLSYRLTVLLCAGAMSYYLPSPVREFVTCPVQSYHALRTHLRLARHRRPRHNKGLGVSQ